MDFNLTGALEEGLRSTLVQFGSPGMWRFSDLGGCPRCQILKRLGFATHETISLASLFILEMGHVIEHEALTWISKSPNIDILAKQTRVYLPQFTARGTLDALSRIGNHLVPIEVKSTRDRALEYRIPYHNHELQAGGYAWALNLTGSFIQYIGRDGTMEHCWVENSQTLRDEIADQWETLNLFWDSVPDRNKGESDAEFYQRLSPYLPPAPKAVVKPVLDKFGQPELYKRAGKWGPAGTPKTEFGNDGSCSYCKFGPYCCYINDSMPEPKLALQSGVPERYGDSATLIDSPLPPARAGDGVRQVTDGSDSGDSQEGTGQAPSGAGSEARIRTQKGWEVVPQETWLAAIEREKIANTRAQGIS